MLLALYTASPVKPGHHTVSPLWVADAICETGQNPPNWRYHAGVYEGGIGFYYTTWDSWKLRVPAARRFDHAYQAPAWIQAAVAQYGLDHYGRWGCLYHSSVWAHR